MYKIEIKNCNSIKNGKIEIGKNKLNIKYGINGTGKSTIAKALQMSSDDSELQSLKSYFATEPASVVSNPKLKKVIVFNEEFVNQVVFKENEVIEKSFEVFLKTPKYDEKKKNLDNRLLKLHGVIADDEEIVVIKELLKSIDARFKRTGNGNLSKTGTFKSILSKQNIYNVPAELVDYKSFFENTEINIPWIDWKNKGDEYDVGENCPYCAEKIKRQSHDIKKIVFKENYTKADSKNLKEILELFESLEEYIKKEKYLEVISCVKEDMGDDVISILIDKLLLEINLIMKRFEQIEGFGRQRIAISDIGNLEEEINKMRIPEGALDIFTSKKIKKVLNKINETVDLLLTELGLLKKEMGDLKGLMNATIRDSQKDINEFLKNAGINYEIAIIAEDEINSKTILRQCYTEEKTDVSKIREHLSWGEKNAFALILFMYYANMQNPDLIILDDPISSFDSNKKYAILHRLFKNIGKKDVSFERKTVLLLTHDFEPITDFLVVGKLDRDTSIASFLWNEKGNVKEISIDIDKDIKLIFTECAEIALDETINIVSRVAFLRKLCELNECQGKWGYAYEILSCLIHASEIKRKIANDVFVDMNESEQVEGIAKIREFIPNFEYDTLRTNVYNVQGIKNIYLNESNVYLKIQLFRAIKEVDQDGVINISKMDDAWFKYIDETYHIENDYLHYLDVRKFNIVPDYIVAKVDEVVAAL